MAADRRKEVRPVPEQARKERRTPRAGGKKETALSRRLAEETRRRARQLEAAAAISSAASSVLSVAELLPLAVELIRERFDLYYVGIFLLDTTPSPGDEAEGAEARGRAVLRAGTGPAGRAMLDQDYSLPVGGSSMIGACLADGRARIALDVGAEAVRFDNPFLPETRSEMALPLNSRGRVVGAMTIQSDRPSAFSPEDVAVLQTMADQLGNAIENARLFDERERRITELAMVNEIGRALSLALSPEDLFEIVHAQVSRLYVASNFYIATYEEGSEAWTSAFHVEGGERQALARYTIDRGLTGHIIRHRTPVLFANRREVQAFHEDRAIGILGQYACSWLGVPLLAANELLGVMAIQDYDKENAYGPDDLALFLTIGAQVAGALRNVRLLEESRRRARAQQLLFEVASAMTSVLDVDAVLREIVERVKESFDYFFVGIFLLEGDELAFRSGSAVGDSKQRFERGEVRMPLGGTGLTVAAFNQGRPLMVNDVTLDSRYSQGEGLEPVRAELDTPIKVKGRIIGVLSVQSDHVNAFSQEDVAILQSLANQAGAAIDNARLFAETEDALAETETLYNVSRLLAAAGDLQDIVAAVAEGMFLPGIDRAVLWSIERDEHERPIALSCIANWHSERGRRPLPVGARFALSDFPAARLTLAPAPIFVQDVDADERLDAATRAALAQQDSRALAILPLWVGRRQSGLLMLVADKPHHFTAREIRPYRSLAGQLAIAVENRRLFQQTQQQLAEQAAAADEQSRLAAELQARANELALLNEMGAALAAALDVESVVETVYRNTSRLLDTTNFYLARYDPEMEEVWFPIMVEGNRRRPAAPRRKGAGLTEYVIRTGQPLLIEENLPERFREIGVMGVGPMALSWVGVPIKVGDRVLGVLALQSYDHPRHYGPRDCDLLLAIANQAAIALENARLFEETQAALAEVEKTHRGYLRGAWQEHLRQYRALNAGGLLYERLAPARQEEGGETPSRAVGGGKGPAGKVASVPDLWRPEMERALGGGYSALPEDGRGGLAVPITLRGQTLGVLGVEAPPGSRQWTEDDLALVQAVSEQLAQTLEAARLFADSQRSAERERLIGEITSRIRASTDVQAILETTASELARALGTPRALVRLAADALPPGSEEGHVLSGAEGHVLSGAEGTAGDALDVAPPETLAARSSLPGEGSTTGDGGGEGVPVDEAVQEDEA
jgi:GAF domain-containing protein